MGDTDPQNLHVSAICSHPTKSIEQFEHRYYACKNVWALGKAPWIGAVSITKILRLHLFI